MNAGRTKLIHAIRWLSAEQNMPFWASPGVYFALRILQRNRDTHFPSKRIHGLYGCYRCAKIRAVARQGVERNA